MQEKSSKNTFSLGRNGKFVELSIEASSPEKAIEIYEVFENLLNFFDNFVRELEDEDPPEPLFYEDPRS